MTETTMNTKTSPASGVKDAPTSPESKALKIAILVSAAIAIVGIVFWMIQLNGGMVQTNMRNLTPWGLYITAFMFFVGLSAGGLIISSVPTAFGMKGFGGISKVAIMTSIASVCAAIGFVVVDLGGPLRLWELFVYSNLTSPLMWDILVIGTYLVLSCIYLWAHMRYEAGKITHTTMRIISVIALCVAISVHTVTAWIFSLAPAHEFWHTALMGPWFVVSALDCGTALVLIAVLWLRKVGYLKLDQQHVINLAKMLGVFVLVDLYFFACDLITSGYFGQSDVVQMLISGQLAPFFWAQIILMILALVLVFTPKLRTSTGVMVASVLTIVAVFFKRCQILLGGFQIADIALPQQPTQYTIPNWQNGVETAYESLIYWPQPIEFCIALGVVSLGVLVFLLGLKFLDLKPKE